MKRSEGYLEEEFQESKPRFEKTEALAEAERCLNCAYAPCISACPTSINIPQFISRIANHDTLGAAKTILQANIMGLSCAHACPTEVLCEGACVYHRLNKPALPIGRLQRYAVETAYDMGAQFFSPGKATGKRVALIGSGPASLSCAHELRILGHEAHVFEKHQEAGGLNTFGIAPYKMKAAVSTREIQQLSQIGIHFHFGQELGNNLNLSGLMKDFDAVFLGIGTGEDQILPIEGLNDPQLKRYTIGAVELIRQIKTAQKNDLPWLKKILSAVIIGGGNTALDACRILKKMGIPDVFLSYRRSENEMSGYLHERVAALHEGVRFFWNTLPTSVSRIKSHEAREADRKENSKVPPYLATSEALEPIHLFLDQTKADAQGKIHLQNRPFSLATSLVVFATGQKRLESLLAEAKGVCFDQGRPVVSSSGQTGNPQIFAGGDLVSGGQEVVHAVAEGKKAAQGIHSYLFPETPNPKDSKENLAEMGEDLAFLPNSNTIAEQSHG